jgi:5-methylcytosine-specific restriction endonuclease McrA
MTQDHIVPRAKGGKNHISNLQTMCYECNYEKGNKRGEELEAIYG